MNKIVDIPPKMEKYYGKGKLLHPSVEAIEELIITIPKGYVATIDVITKRLARDFGTDMTCPLRTGNAIKKMADSYSNETLDVQMPFWRVIRTDKKVIKSKNFELWASMLEDEGFALNLTKSGHIKVEVDSGKLFDFESDFS